MLIVCTRDPAVVAAAQDPDNGAADWGTRVIIDHRFNQAQATAAIEQALKGLNEPLCFSCHGNDDDIGDEGSGGKNWGWSRLKLAAMLAAKVPKDFAGPILIHACAQRISNFSAGLANELASLRVLNGVWCYGYNRAVPTDAGFPAPAKLARHASLQGSQVHYQANDAPFHASGAASGSYRATFPGGYSIELPVGFDPDEAHRFLTLLAGSQLR